MGGNAVNFDQVLTITLVPLGMAAILFLVMSGLLWGQIKTLQRRVRALGSEVRTIVAR